MQHAVNCLHAIDQLNSSRRTQANAHVHFMITDPSMHSVIVQKPMAWSVLIHVDQL